MVKKSVLIFCLITLFTDISRGQTNQLTFFVTEHNAFGHTNAWFYCESCPTTAYSTPYAVTAELKYNGATPYFLGEICSLCYDISLVTIGGTYKAAAYFFPNYWALNIQKMMEVAFGFLRQETGQVLITKTPSQSVSYALLQREAHITFTLNAPQSLAVFELMSQVNNKTLAYDPFSYNCLDFSQELYVKAGLPGHFFDVFMKQYASYLFHPNGEWNLGAIYLYRKLYGEEELIKEAIKQQPLYYQVERRGELVTSNFTQYYQGTYLLDSCGAYQCHWRQKRVTINKALIFETSIEEDVDSETITKVVKLHTPLSISFFPYTFPFIFEATLPMEDGGYKVFFAQIESNHTLYLLSPESQFIEIFLRKDAL